MKTNQYFKYFLLLIIVLTMYNNLDHSANVYYLISGKSANMLQAYLVVIAIDLSVIAFIITGKHRESVVFAWLIFAVNCIFFDVLSSFYQVFFAKNVFQSLNDFLAKVIFSAVFSYSIHRFSHLWSEQNEKADLLEFYRDRSENLEKELQIITVAYEKFESLNENSQNQLTEVQNDLTTFHKLVETYENELEIMREREKHVRSYHTSLPENLRK